jgi:hypothetical protein
VPDVSDEAVARTILTLRLVLLAIALGIIVFSVVAAILVSTDAVPARPELGSSLLPALVAAAVLMMVVFVLVRQVLRADLRPEKLLPRFLALTIVSGALAELPSLFGVVVFLLTRQWAALLAPILGLAALVLLFPSRDKFARFAESAARSRDI